MRCAQNYICRFFVSVLVFRGKGFTIIEPIEDTCVLKIVDVTKLREFVAKVLIW